MVGLGVDIGDIADYVGAQRPRHRRAPARARRGAASRAASCWPRAWSSTARAATRCPRARRRAPGPRARAADLDAGASSRRARSAARALAPETVAEDAPLDPRNVYAATKLAQEHLCAAFARETGVPVTALRYHNVYGPRMPRDTPYAGVASIFRSRARGAARPPRVFEDGGQRRDFVHVRDVAARQRAARCSRPTRSPAPSTSPAARRAPCSRWPTRSPTRSRARPGRVVTGEWRAGDVRHIFASAAARRGAASASAPRRTSRPGCASSPRSAARHVTPAARGLAATLALMGLAMAVPTATGWDVHVRWFPPLHAEWDPRVAAGTLPAIALAALAARHAVDLSSRLSWRPLLAAVFAAGLAWMLSLALVDGTDGVGHILETPYEYLRAARRVTDVHQLLQEYVSRIPFASAPRPNWPVHLAGHPPGAVLVFIGLDRLGLGGALSAGMVVTIAAATTAVAVLVCVRALGGETMARRAAPFLVFAPAAVWQAVSADALFAAVAAWALAALAVAERDAASPGRSWPGCCSAPARCCPTACCCSGCLR